MFTTKERVFEVTGVEVDGQTLSTANMMVEAYVGRPEADITDASDLRMLENATVFQAIYIRSNVLDMLEQVAVTSNRLAENTMVMNQELMAPFMSPFAVLTLHRLSWRRSRSVRTGPVFDRVPRLPVWEMD